MRHILMLAGSDAKNTPRFLSEHLHDNFAELMRLKIFCSFGQWAVVPCFHSDTPRSVSCNQVFIKVFQESTKQ